jgi:putative component of membrane protein insertase Oxa1/YidC/SpoIIIJ protein YidD
MQKRIVSNIPIANFFNAASRGLAITAISGYQRFISPHKGFSCAHRVLYGCESCSQYFKRVIAEEGITTAIANAQGRFQECREANEILRTRRSRCRQKYNQKYNQKYYASRLSPQHLAMESGEQGNENPDIPDSPDTPVDGQTARPKLGGAQWGRKTRSQADNHNANNNSANNNNCNQWDYVDCTDCAYGLDSISCDGSDRQCDNPFESMSCPDLNCDGADCLSSIDCSGLDCGSLDCLSCGDCGSCG